MATTLKQQTVSGVKWLVAIAALIICVNILDQIFNQPSWQIHRLFDMDREANFSSWFSSLLWLIAAYSAYMCYRTAKSRGLSCWIWPIVSIALLYLSCDEGAQLHEYLGTFINKHFLHWHMPKMNWIIILAPAILAVTVFFIITLRKTLADSRKAALLMASGLALLILGSIALESTAINDLCKEGTRLYGIEVILEESLEMFGAILILSGLIEHRRLLSS
jgi:hypothetical protein